MFFLHFLLHWTGNVCFNCSYLLVLLFLRLRVSEYVITCKASSWFVN